MRLTTNPRSEIYSEKIVHYVFVFSVIIRGAGSKHNQGEPAARRGVPLHRL